MTKPNYTHLSLLVDRSGSMSSIREDSEGGINTLIEEQAKVDGEITVSLYQFDDAYEKVFGPIDAKDAPKYSLVPRSMTALLDSSYKAIQDTGEYLASLDEAERPSKVIFAIVTDGHENASTETTVDQLKSTIEHQTNAYNWEFIYIGANVDAFGVGASLGISTTTQYKGTGASAAGTYQYFTRSVTAARLNDVAIASTMPTAVDADGNEA